MHHEALAVLAHQRVDDLLVLLGAQRGGDQCLRLAAREQRRTVGTRQNAEADLDRADRARVTAIDARLAVQDLAANDLRLQVEQDRIDRVVVGLRLAVRDRLGVERRGHLRFDVLDLLRARLLVADLVGVLQVLAGDVDQLGGQGFVLAQCLPLPHRLAGVAHEFVDGVDRRLHLGVAVHHGAQHHVFRQLVGFGLDHQHGAFGAGNDQVQARGLQLGGGRVDDVLPVEIADTGSTDRALERDAGQRQRRRRPDHRRDVGIDLRINRQHVDDHLHFVEEAIGKERPDRTVDQPTRQGFLLGRSPFALEESARDAAGGVRLFDVVDGEREEVLTRLGFLARHHGGQHDGVVHRAHDRAARLARDLARLQRHGVRTVRKLLGYLVKHLTFLSC